MAKNIAFRGRRTCSCMAEWLVVYEAMLIEAKVIKRRVDIFQLIGTAAASAGFHRTGGAADLAQSSTQALRIARNMGAAGFGRSRADGMTPHQHLVLKGCPHLTNGSRAQIPELERGGDGLVGSRRDRGPRSGIQWPLRTWRQGIKWAELQLQEDEVSAKEVWDHDDITPPSGTNRKWKAKSALGTVLRDTHQTMPKRLDAMEKRLKSMEKQIAAIAAAVEKIPKA